MANETIDPIACIRLGYKTDEISCCYASNQTTDVCNRFFGQESILQAGCQSGDCIADCQSKELVYTSFLQDNLTGNGKGPIRRYMACANVPSIATYQRMGLLTPANAAASRQFIAQNASDESLRNITSTVTDCLSSTCRASRRRRLCYDDYCSPMQLLAKNSSPNLTAIHRCLNRLCYSNYAALPYADVDVIGIGVFSSYILQCLLILMLWAGLVVSGIYKNSKRRRHAANASVKLPSRRHHRSWMDLLLQFHITQCYFSGTLMIASLSYGIYETSMLVVFMFIPVATNGILPVVFAYLLLVYYWKSSTGITLLTIAVYILSSAVYWSLYAQIISLADISRQDIYQQFMFKLSAIPACGGYSALAVCPHISLLGFKEVKLASDKLIVLTPFIWTFSTAVLVTLLGFQLYQWNAERKSTEATSKQVDDAEPMVDARGFERPRVIRMAFWATTLGMIVGMAAQLSLLGIGTSLNMMNLSDWSFGQIVAVTIWVPPLLDYFYGELKGVVNRMVGKGDVSMTEQELIRLNTANVHARESEDGEENHGRSSEVAT
ncbi:hypothetical protein P152DRAFT_66125 [Eremomyces bilateralis CBS 781.70]|uniref:Uncharacterized protein n=1 Tax=Eremomyces bilateralis CBS 781.70 TaxID=1392243 RepID=A0A6G1FZK0_9PEZI|nr:uncharacterized protein P152DRAFT_66125 [Eremomyces bilateralis CBS 781.70]KAF1811224.1 hypothetical protein P152DRAFT_66125 [Eremomyces bilateralis CBS 781.70]